jgi:hypothetical protein
MVARGWCERLMAVMRLLDRRRRWRIIDIGGQVDRHQSELVPSWKALAFSRRLKVTAARRARPSGAGRVRQILRARAGDGGDPDR